ncbi:MAG: hypothetical protein CMC70_04015 [Flavobacteriaceae bacterium]|nr:hypothetical protein [Flavobacteriaceae bacterium]
MSKTLRNTLYILGGIVVLFFIVLITSNIIVKNKIEKATKEELPNHISVAYKDLSLHLLTGTLTYKDVSITLKNKANDSTHTYISTEKATVKNVSYWDYLFNNTIHIEDIKIIAPKLKYYKNENLPSQDTTTSQEPSINLNKPILIGKLRVENTLLTFFENKKDTLFLAKNVSLEVDSILVNNNTLKNRLPAQFGNYKAQTDSIFVKVSPFENLTLSNLSVQNKKATVSNLHLATKYSKEQHARILEKERDHFNVTLQQLEIEGIDFGFKNRKFYAKSSLVQLDSVVATIYRNKLVADDLSKKPLYSKMLRELPIGLTIDSLQIKNSALTYQEKVKEKQPAGTIYFNNLNAHMAHISNTYGANTETKIDITSTFMKTAPIVVDWSFNVNDTSDAFTFKADIDALPASKMNSFTKPNLLVGLTGTANQTYFSIYGNSSNSKIDLRIKYSNFKVNLLEDGKENKKKLLSSIVNIFVNKDSNNNSEGFTTCSAEVTPDKTKSFFNYLWLNVRDGLKDCLL